MNGFEQETVKKLQGINAHISIDGGGQHLNFKAIQSVIIKEFPHIKTCTPIATKQVIIQVPGSDDISNVVMLQAIEPQSQAQVTTLEKTVKNNQKLTECVYNDHILIGSQLAQRLEAQQGELLTVLFAPDTLSNNRILFDQEHAHIGGIFSTGIEEFDNHVIYCSFKFLEKLYPDSGVSHIDMLSDRTHEESTAQQLKERFKLPVFTWKQRYPALVSALKLEKYAMFFILSLIIIVASMNIMSLLFMQIRQKHGDIAILRALGMRYISIRAIFLYMGIIIALCATLCGLTCAFCASIFLKRYPLIELPDAYYVTHLPVSIEFQTYLTIFLTIMIISCITTWYATRQSNRISISSILRFET